jgi:dTMP kinase
LPVNRGRLIAIEGIDQSGKRTQSALLARKLSGIGRKASILSFPDYSTPIGRQIRAYLTGKNLFDYHAIHLLYAANKWERVPEISRRISLGHNIIINRYSPSNLAYGVAHGLPLGWLESLEKGLPKPGIVLILDIDPKASLARKRRRRDVHENDLGYLRRVRRAYIRLAPRFGWKIIDGTRQPSHVQHDLWAHVARDIA